VSHNTYTLFIPRGQGQSGEFVWEYTWELAFASDAAYSSLPNA